MTAAETVENLLKLASVINDAVQKRGPSSTDWNTFLTSAEFQSISSTVAHLLSSIKKSDVDSTIKALGEKQQALLGGKALADLPTDKLIQYGELGNMKVMLAADQVAESINADFAGWLVDDALPVLVKAAPVVIPLLI